MYILLKLNNESANSLASNFDSEIFITIKLMVVKEDRMSVCNFFK